MNSKIIFQTLPVLPVLRKLEGSVVEGGIFSPQNTQLWGNAEK